ncbi:N-lysine methyltransferase KMT5A [Thalassophryne amazonica]|uniref:N-lysine methyltransferase KMT5A n=1 Tax=Thalassophryne amazonica TaxID=390379 RepID=UPI001471584B|nr:N-lysine methyltransferase KMT5A [Thalassophryne amazonica]
MKTGASLLKGYQIIHTLGSDSSGESGDDAACTSVKSHNIQMDFQVVWDKFLVEFPVTLDGTVPTRISRCAVSQEHQRKIYERWLKTQMKMRVEHVISHFNRRLPSTSRVAAWIARQGWRSNIPVADTVLKAWKPSGSMEDMPTSKHIRRLISNQKWKGLALKDIEGKGKGVVAARRFVAGEVVCDYHGQVVTGAEGEEIHKNTNEEDTAFMFFYTKDGQRMCFDAHASTCTCHPDQQPFGRMISHSRKKANVRPRLYTLDLDGNERDVLLFLAVRDIKDGEEILFDYGVKRNSFCGVGLQLDWI